MNESGQIPLSEAERRERARGRQRLANGHEDPASRLAPFRVHNANEISLCLNTSYIVKRYLYPGELSFWYGPSGCGKTFILQYLLWKVMLGEPVFGQRVRGGPMFYMSLEPGRLDWRLSAARATYGESDKFFYTEDPFNLFTSAEGVDQIITAAKEIGARVIVVDPLGAAMAGANENDFTDVSVVINRLRRIGQITGAHVACVAHTGKDQERGQRGSSHWYASGDLVVAFSEGQNGERVAEIMKARDAPRGDAFRFKLSEYALGVDDDGDSISTLFASEIVGGPLPAGPSDRRKLPAQTRQAFELLKEAIGEHGELGAFGVPPGIPAIRRRTWANVAAKRLCESEEATYKAISRAIVALRNAGMIGTSMPWIWIVQ